MLPREKVKVIIQKAQSVSKLIIKFGSRCVGWVLTYIIALAIGIAIAIANVSKALYRKRSKIVGALLLVDSATLLILWANELLGLKGDTLSLHNWLMLDYHWAIVAGAISFTVLTTWNYISPTLRTLFGKGWVGISLWTLLGIVLLAVAYAGVPHADISYRDAYVGSVILYITALAVIAKIRPKGFALQESFYVADNPADHDGAEVYETQKRLIADIRYLIAGGQPSVFAISGRWGVGKTFLLLQAKDELIKDESIIWMKFEPWRYASEEALIRGFYHDIGATLADKMLGIQNIIKPLAEATDKFIRQRDGTGIFGAAMDTVRAISKPTENPETQIEELLDRERKRLVVVIDDVERSFDAERIFRTLQLAHYAKNIQNVQVVFLCDKDVVLKARPAHFTDASQDATEYLEKFVEREVTVPSPRPSELHQHFATLMKAHQDKPGFDFSEEDLPEGMLEAIGTPRAIIRLFNEFAAFRVNLEGGENES